MQSRAQGIPGRRQTAFQGPRTSKGKPMDLHALWYVLAALMVIVGLAGTILPALPGLPLVFGGMLLAAWADGFRSEEHTSELQSLMRISYAVFCLIQKTLTKHLRDDRTPLTQHSHSLQHTRLSL